MFLQAAVNGSRSRDEHAAVPITAEEIAEDLRRCVAAGATDAHIHPRGSDGRPTLDPSALAGVVTSVRSITSMSIGVTTLASIEPVLERRLALVRSWRARPDYASVNVSEPGWIDVALALLESGTSVEAGIWTVQDADAFILSGLTDRVTRVLVEPIGARAGDALEMVADIHSVLDRGGVTVPRLQHGDGDSTWPLLEDALRRGLQTRIGFEDTLLLPDGTLAAENRELVAAAVALAGG